MNLVDLPPYFLLSFISDEILLIELINVNSAYCNKDTRNKLLFLISIRATPIHKDKGVICEQLCIHCGLQNKSLIVDLFFVGNLQNENYDFIFDSLLTNYSSGTTSCATKFSRIKDLRSKPKMISHSCGSTSTPIIIEKILNWPTTYDHIAFGYDNSQSIGIIAHFDPNICWELLEGEWWRNRKPGKGKGFIKFFATTVIATQFKIYKGELNGLIMSGHGVMTYVNGQIYTGDWQFDQRCGYGECTYPNRFDSGVGRYFGLWSNDMREGQGVLAFSNGDVYNGEWCEDRMNGKGKLQFRNGGIYTGDFIDDQYHGEGTFVSSTLSNESKYSYIGSWVYGKKEGVGVMQYYSNGTEYSGMWVANKRHGHGTLTSRNGDKPRAGEWENDKQVGLISEMLGMLRWK